MSAPRGRPFPPGNALGRGRPKGSRNRPKAPAQEMLDKYAEPLTAKCLSLAMQGDHVALRLCMERIHPVRRGASIHVPLPPVVTAADVNRAAEKVTQSVGRGKITPTDGAGLISILEGRLRIFGSVEWESRLSKAEEKVAA